MPDRTPYRPANGTEGLIFMERWCARCAHDREFREGTGDSCPIAAETMVLPADAPEYPREWIADDRGPRCTAFRADDPREPGIVPDARQREMAL